MSVRRSAWLAAATGVVLLLVFGLFLFQQTLQFSRAVDSMRAVFDPASAQTALLQTALSDMDRGVTGFVVSGEERDLNPYVNGARRSDLALQQLRGLIDGEEQLEEVVAWVSLGRQEYIEQVARPTIDAVRADDRAAALAVLEDPASDELAVQLGADTATLSALIEERRTQAFSSLADLSLRLVVTVIASVVLLWGFLMLAFALAHSKVLRPLDELRRQIRQVARRGEHNRAITPSGPVELRALGADVEELRRQLVAEIDEARSAREALDQQAPVVAAIRSELSAGRPISVPGLSIAGALQPAEGVLAGDWWASTVLPTGEAAVILADISGHGPAAGIAAMQLKNAVQHDLLAGRDIDDVAVSAAEVFESHPDRFATVAAVCVQPDTGDVRYINAGHHEPLVVDEEGAVVAQLARTGPILSWLGGQWAVGTAELRPGQTLLLYSDGLIESHDAAGDELGEQQLLSWLAEMPEDQRDPDDLVPWLLGAARQRAVDWNRDDVTVVAVRRDAVHHTRSSPMRHVLRKRAQDASG